MSNEGGREVVSLRGDDLSVATLARIARNPDTVEVECHPEAVKRVRACRAVIDKIIDDYRKAWGDGPQPGDPASLPRVYGVTTGFGEFKRVDIPPQRLRDIQANVLLSHATGVGSNLNRDDLANYFPADIVRAVLVLRLNTFLKGNSGVRAEVLDYIKAMVNRGIIPLVPLRGSVGSSGDLCPLSHLFVTLMGHGRYYLVGNPADLANASPGLKDAKEKLASDLGMSLFEPAEKEGLALTNGASFAAAALALATYDAEAATNAADVAAALSFEAVCGRTRCLDERIHQARSMWGQQDSAANLRALLVGSQWLDRANDVQDAYSLRCAPQVHGASRDAVSYVRNVVEWEINASTDNPLFFAGQQPFDLELRAAKEKEAQRTDEEHYRCTDVTAYSAGNFHGQPVALAADFLAIALAELGSISERRIQTLLDANHNRNLPSNLVPEAGLNSGFMISHYCAAGLVSENKVLAHPASVDSIPTSANTEDHVSMATIAARKVRDVLAHTESVLAIELMCAAQAVEWRIGVSISPRDDGKLEETDREEKDRRDGVFCGLPLDEADTKVAGQLGPGTRAAYESIRAKVHRLVTDRVLDEDLRLIRQMIDDGSLLGAVELALAAVGRSLRPIRHLSFAEDCVE
jgi:histidine ammonia-lyase